MHFNEISHLGSENFFPLHRKPMYSDHHSVVSFPTTLNAKAGTISDASKLDMSKESLLKNLEVQLHSGYIN